MKEPAVTPVHPGGEKREEYCKNDYAANNEAVDQDHKLEPRAWQVQLEPPVSNGIYFVIVVILNLTVVFHVVAKLVLETPAFT